jgi:hypothetical protein
MPQRALAGGIAVTTIAILATGCQNSNTTSAPRPPLPRTRPAVSIGQTRPAVDGPVCKPNAITIRMRPTGHPVDAHNWPWRIVFVNGSRRPCVLRGFPFARIDSAAPVSWRRVTRTSHWPYPPQVARRSGPLRVTALTVAPHGGGYAYLAFDNGAQCGRSYPAYFSIGLTRRSAIQLGQVNTEVCRGNVIDLSPFTATKA